MPTVKQQLTLLRRWLDAPDAEARRAIETENGGVPLVSTADAALLSSEEYAAYRRRLTEELLHGPYTPPPRRRRDRAYCLVRDCEVIITGWNDALLPWPRCRAAGRSGRASGGGSGLLVCEELARAVRCESAAAVMYWWGVSHGAIHRWRKARASPGPTTRPASSSSTPVQSRRPRRCGSGV